MEKNEKLFATGEIDKVLKKAQMDQFVPGAIRLEDVIRLLAAAETLGLITQPDSTLSVVISANGDFAVEIEYANGIRLVSEWVGDHFLKHLVHVDMSNNEIANRLLSWAVSEAVETEAKFKQHYALRSV